MSCENLINYEMNTNGYLDITFGPIWSYIPLTRNYIENFLMINLEEQLGINKIVMTASELLENAVKYSSEDGIRVKITKHIDKDMVDLVVLNALIKTDYEKLKVKVEEANNAENTLEYYVNKMKESYARNDGKAGLGIPRIRHEAEAKLNLTYFPKNDASGILEVKVSFNTK